MTGSTVSHYLITEQIGFGGMGVVWKAIDTRLDREVALKFLHEEAVADPAARDRFLREARAASALNHPNIITIHEIDRVGDAHFIVMELVQGCALSDLIHQCKRLPATLAVEYALQICEGLAAAHRAGITHRDIKPSTLMVSREGIVKILDFGLAKMVESQTRIRDGPGAITRSGTIVGTTPYMSPEQAVGDPAGPRSDVFSLGVVLYEMLSGKRPFAGTTNTEVVRSILAAEQPPLQSIVSGLPPALVEIVHQCLRKPPAERFSDAGALAARLCSAAGSNRRHTPADASTVSIPRDGHDQRRWPVPRLLRRRPFQAAIAAISLAVAGYFAWPALREPSTPARIRMSGASIASIQETQALLRRYDRRGSIDQAIETVRAGLRKDPSNATLHALLAEAGVRKFLVDRDAKLLEEAVESGKRAIETNDELAAAHIAYGMGLQAKGKTPEARAQFERAIELNPISAPAHTELGRLSTGAEAERLHQQAVHLDPTDWRAFDSLAAFYYRAARYDECFEAWRRALDATPDNALVMSRIGAAQHARGRYAEAAAMLQQALTLDGTSPAVFNNLSTAYYFQGLFVRAARAAEKAVELAPDNYLYWGTLGDARRGSRESEQKTKDAYASAIRIVKLQIEKSPDDRVRTNLAVYLAKSGDSGRALAELAALKPDSFSDRTMVFQSAVILEVTGQRERALEALGRAIQGGYSMHEITNEPELASLRSDPRYARIVDSVQPPRARKGGSDNP